MKGMERGQGSVEHPLQRSVREEVVLKQKPEAAKCEKSWEGNGQTCTDKGPVATMNRHRGVTHGIPVVESTLGSWSYVREQEKT